MLPDRREFPRPLRLVSWNCCRRADARDRPEILALDPDIVILQEARSNGAGAFVPVRPNLGIAVAGRNGFAVEPLLSLPERAALLVRVTRRTVTIPLLAIWALPKPTYCESVTRAVDTALEIVSPSDLVVAGDFNAMVTPLAKRESKQALALFDRLNRLGLTSAYHSVSARIHGDEPHPTHFFRWKREHPFHIDYCFVPQSWRVVSAEIGDAETWGGLSDHLPLIVDLEPGGITPD